MVFQSCAMQPRLAAMVDGVPWKSICGGGSGGWSPSSDGEQRYTCRGGGGAPFPCSGVMARGPIGSGATCGGGAPGGSGATRGPRSGGTTWKRGGGGGVPGSSSAARGPRGGGWARARWARRSCGGWARARRSCGAARGPRGGGGGAAQGPRGGGDGALKQRDGAAWRPHDGGGRAARWRSVEAARRWRRSAGPGVAPGRGGRSGGAVATAPEWCGGVAGRSPTSRGGSHSYEGKRKLQFIPFARKKMAEAMC
ncbi:hypothetical protein GUJ93_ZPchr0011g28833 [Zizania palustris]|uniref:Uncharacterized protein n=1 Tax=Zizania palustris TaxID=103762 RepID=A0A8J6BMF6_ZIZPA|nr:hypothetical protein GUJ93_ZPchr0011g28833 [Zizania palustris]